MHMAGAAGAGAAAVPENAGHTVIASGVHQRRPWRDVVDRPFFAVCRSEEHTSELQSLMRISYAVFCLKKKKNNKYTINYITNKTTDTKPKHMNNNTHIDVKDTYKIQLH